MKFMKFVNEAEVALCEGTKEDIINILNTMGSDEVSEFGEFVDNSLDGDNEFFDEDEYTKEEVIELLGELGSDDLDYALYMLGDDEDSYEADAEDAHTEDNANIDESLEEKTARKMKASKRVKGKKRFTKSKSELRRGKASRKKELRKTKVARKKYRTKHRVNIKKYAKSYSKDVASGRHKKKVRRG